MDEIKEQQNRVACALTTAIIHQYKAASHCFPDPAGRLTLAMGTAMVGISATCQLVIETGLENTPSRDELLFACLLISNSAEFTDVDDNKDALVVEFNMDNIVKTIDQFRDITGRSIEVFLNKSLIEQVNDLRNKAAAAFHDDMTQFKPQ